jgi:2-methylaconitate cis-trans-isomerase PrpF
MRGGTSKGPFFLANDLPDSSIERDLLLISIMGSGHPLQIDGIGGGNPLTSKVAIISKSTHPGADVDYLFAQVRIDEQFVDLTPNCGNMLAAVGPFAIEAGLVRPAEGMTTVRIFNTNTGKAIEAQVPTRNGAVTYLGDAHISGAPGTAAPISLSFSNAAGAMTGALLPTGAAIEMIGGVLATCFDCAIPMVLLRAEDFGLRGDETPAALDADTSLLAKIESIRLEAAERMGIANAGGRVVPKPVLLSPPSAGGTIRARYFMPHQCHTALATTGAVGIATACAHPDTVAARIAGLVTPPSQVVIEHPSGVLEVSLSRDDQGEIVAGLMRTARRLFEGRVFAKPLNPDASKTSSVETMDVYKRPGMARTAGNP